MALLFAGRFKAFFTRINGLFLGLLILGVVVSYFSVSKILDYLLQHFELYVWSWFFGLIIGSIYYIIKHFGSWNRTLIPFLLLGIAVGISISFLEPATQNNNLWFVFLCGIISVSGMTLPGLSGSFILILLGNYVLLLVDAVNALYDAIRYVFQGDFSFLQDSTHTQLLIILAVFALGSVTGLVSLSHVLGFVLKRFKKTTNAVIIGFISGSLGVVWPWKTKTYEKDVNGQILLDANQEPIVKNFDRFFPTEWHTETFLALVAILIGICMVLIISKYHEKRLTNG
mgnify:CR=1 FL=1